MLALENASKFFGNLGLGVLGHSWLSVCLLGLGVLGLGVLGLGGQDSVFSASALRAAACCARWCTR